MCRGGKVDKDLLGGEEVRRSCPQGLDVVIDVVSTESLS